MRVIQTDLPEVLLLEPKVFGDARGFFMESYNARAFAEATGLQVEFVQDNHSRSARGVLRGLHYQVRQPQAVDLRHSSPTFGRWTGAELSEENNRQMWVPPGFAHGFVVLSESADFLYKTTDYYAPEYERSLMWNDPAVGVDWQFEGEPLLSEKDRAGLPLAQCEVYP
jgi:dTDP-4-dehydrorhamnose 3,5-epimerase